MKTCLDCKIDYEIEEFPWKNKTKGIRVGRCKTCHNKWYKEYFSKPNNKKKHIQKVNSVNKRQLEENRKRVYDYLNIHPCIDCGETNPIVLEFDHRNPKEKSFGICGTLMTKSYVSWEMILQEIEKCDIRCANCHRIKTANDYGFWKVKLVK